MIDSKKQNGCSIREFYRDFPKVELHRHLEGSVTPEMLLEIAQKYKVSLPTKDLEELKRAIQIDGQVASLKEFLNRFYLLGHAFPTLEAVEEVTWRVCQQCAREGIRLVELRFSPVFMSLEKPHGWPALLEAIISGTERARTDFSIEVGLIIGVSRSNSSEKAREVIELAERFRAQGLVGLDLFGDEAQFPPDLFIESFRHAREKNLNITVHAGEGGEETNIRTAVEELGASRIGHGVRVVNDPELGRWLRERNIPLELCLTSNVQTCTVPSLEAHPVKKIYDSGIRISLNTDDPGISNTTLIEEYSLASEVFSFSVDQMKGLVRDALAQSFIDSDRKDVVSRRLEHELASFPSEISS